MSVNNETLDQFEYVLKKLIKRYPAGVEDCIMTDLSIQVKSDTGELILFNDDDEIIATCVIAEWINDERDEFYKFVASDLKDFFQKKDKELEELSILHPFSIVLIDEDKETVSEIFQIDDESIILDHEELMAGLEDDLNQFIENLLKS